MPASGARKAVRPATSPATSRSFRPAWWLPGPHAQTIMGRALRPAPKILLHRERLRTPDGDFLDLDYADYGLDYGPVVLLLHGLEGSARARYMLSAYGALGRRGMRSVGLNFRSCSGEPNLGPRLYHSGDTGDLRFVLQHLARRFPDSRRAVLGFSLGGNVLLRMLGDPLDGDAALVHAAVAVSVPYDLDAGATRLERGPSGKIYTEYFLIRLRRKLRAGRDRLGPFCDLERALRARTLRDFDDAATAPLHGFDSAADYYRRASSGPLIGRIRVPTLLLQARDDPFLPAAALPVSAASENPWITPAFQEHGGHMGFVEGARPWAPRLWMEEEAAVYLAVCLTESGPEGPV